MVEAQFDPNKQPVHIDIDETRPYNQRLDEMFADDPFATAYYSNADSWWLTKRLLDDSKATRNNVIYETTPRSVGDIEEIIKGFQSERYAVDLHALAVNSKSIILGIHQRFEAQLMSAVTARWTPIDFHDDAYAVFPKNVAHLERAAGLEIVSLYSRSGEVLYCNDKDPTKRVAQEIIERERGRIWTPNEKEKHLTGWQKVAAQIERRPAGKAKPDWYVVGVRGFLKEAQLFNDARIGLDTDALENGVFEAITHHHIFVRSVGTQELICFEKPSPSTPSRSVKGATAPSDKPQP